MVVVVLDEVDRLVAQDQAVLVELFLLPQVQALAHPCPCSIQSSVVSHPSWCSDPDCS